MEQKNLETTIRQYLTFCDDQKRLDAKTIKAYHIDLTLSRHIYSYYRKSMGSCQI